jgi:hypothetical protein
MKNVGVGTILWAAFVLFVIIWYMVPSSGDDQTAVQNANAASAPAESASSAPEGPSANDSPLSLSPQPVCAHSELLAWVKVPQIISTTGAIEGTTNLPDGTILDFYISTRENVSFNVDNNLYNQKHTVSHGHFGPFTVVRPGVIMPPGNYELNVVMPQVGMLQPEEVVRALGEYGECLTGPIVTIDGELRTVSASFPMMVQ